MCAHAMRAYLIAAAAMRVPLRGGERAYNKYLYKYLKIETPVNRTDYSTQRFKKQPLYARGRVNLLKIDNKERARMRVRKGFSA